MYELQRVVKTIKMILTQVSIQKQKHYILRERVITQMIKRVRSRKRLNYKSSLTTKAARDKIAKKIQKKQDVHVKRITCMIQQNKNKRARELRATRQRSDRS